MMALTEAFWTTHEESRPVQHSAASLQLPEASTRCNHPVEMIKVMRNDINDDIKANELS